jgi:hypothetical protein
MQMKIEHVGLISNDYGVDHIYYVRSPSADIDVEELRNHFLHLHYYEGKISFCNNVLVTLQENSTNTAFVTVKVEWNNWNENYEKQED